MLDAAFYSKWSSIDIALLPALSGVAKTNVLTMQRLAFSHYPPNFGAANAMNARILIAES